MKTFWAIKDKKEKLVCDGGCFYVFTSRKEALSECWEDGEHPVKVRIVEVEE